MDFLDDEVMKNWRYVLSDAQADKLYEQAKKFMDEDMGFSYVLLLLAAEKYKLYLEKQDDPNLKLSILEKMISIYQLFYDESISKRHVQLPKSAGEYDLKIIDLKVRKGNFKETNVFAPISSEGVEFSVGLKLKDIAQNFENYDLKMQAYELYERAVFVLREEIAVCNNIGKETYLESELNGCFEKLLAIDPNYFKQQ